MTGDNKLTDHSGHPLRLLFVHAHPDDETTTTGATTARYAAEGIGVYLVTCTRGERGEILDDELLAKFEGLDPDSAAVRLAEHRTGELAGACERLGFTQWRFLAGQERWWDSGMAGTPTATHAKAFAAGDATEQAAELAAVVRSLRPQVVITYDERGGYGHPDHIRAHDITMAAVRLAADGTGDDGRWLVSKVYACAVPRSQIEIGAAMLASSDAEGPNPLADLVNAPFAVPDELIAARVDGNAWLDAKADAMRAHASQMHVNGWFFKLIEFGAFGLEHYRLLAGIAAPPAGEQWEDDLFSGLRGEPRPTS